MSKTAIISGANGALGSIVVKRFLQNGFFVNGLFHSHPQLAGDSRYRGYQVNLLSEEDTRKTVNEISQLHAAIDALICTAGGFQMGNIENTTVPDLQKQYQINFLTAYHLVQPVYLQMKRQGFGKIFLVGSRQGWDTQRSVNTIAYGLSKSLLFNLANILNEDSKGRVVTTVVVPSTIDTKANRESMPGADYSKWISPDDIADIILFYCSDQAGAIRQPVIKIFGES